MPERQDEKFIIKIAMQLRYIIYDVLKLNFIIYKIIDNKIPKMLEGVLPDSTVTIKDGSLYSINKIKCGDFITTVDVSKLSLGFDMVVSRCSFISEKTGTQMFLIVNDLGNSIIASGGCKFFTKKGWIECRHLNPTSDLLLVNTDTGLKFSKITKLINSMDCLGNGLLTENNLPFIVNSYVILTPEN